MVDTTAGNYAAAVTACQNKGATLTSIIDSVEQDFIDGMLNFHFDIQE